MTTIPLPAVLATLGLYLGLRIADALPDLFYRLVLAIEGMAGIAVVHDDRV
jgi:hypothetical protein